MACELNESKGESVSRHQSRGKRRNLEGFRGSLNSVTTKEGHWEAGGCFQDRFSLKVGSRTEVQDATTGLWPLSGLDLLQTYHLKRNDNLWALVTLDTWKNIQSPLGIHELLGKQAVCRVLLSCMYDISLLLYCKVLCRFWGLFYIYLSIFPTTLGLHNHKHIQVPKTVGTQTIFIEIMNKLMNRWFTCNIGLLTWSPVRNIKAGLKYVWQGYVKWVTANFLGLDNAKSYPGQQGHVEFCEPFWSSHEYSSVLRNITS